MREGERNMPEDADGPQSGREEHHTIPGREA